MEGASSFCGVSDCRVNELTCRVVAANREVLVEPTFSRNVCAGVWEVAEGAFVCGGVAI